MNNGKEKFCLQNRTCENQQILCSFEQHFLKVRTVCRIPKKTDKKDNKKVAYKRTMQKFVRKLVAMQQRLVGIQKALLIIKGIFEN